MDKSRIRSYVASLGWFLGVLGFSSIVFYFLGFEFSILKWLDTWGSSTGLLIKIAITLVGAFLFAWGRFNLFSNRE